MTVGDDDQDLSGQNLSVSDGRCCAIPVLWSRVLHCSARLHASTSTDIGQPTNIEAD